MGGTTINECAPFLWSHFLSWGREEGEVLLVLMADRSELHEGARLPQTSVARLAQISRPIWQP